MERTGKVKIKIINGFGIGYAVGKIYEVEKNEAKRLIEEKKAVPVGGDTFETTEAKPLSKETGSKKIK